MATREKTITYHLVPPPPDITSEQMQANTDGGMFYKITERTWWNATICQHQFQKTTAGGLINFIRNYDPES